MKYRIVERYEHWSREGKVFTKWFPVFHSPITDTPEELKEALKEAKNKTKDISRKMKLKYEYDIEYFDDVEEARIARELIEKEIAAQNRPKRPRGRPRKVTEEPVTKEPKRRGRPKKTDK